MPREIEGDWIWGWPDRKRPPLMEGKDSKGRVIFGRTPLLDLEGLITPVDSYYIVAQLQIPEPIHPDDWVLSISGEVERPIELTLEELRKLPGRTVRAVTECEGNDAEYFNYLRDGGRKPSLASKQDMEGLAKIMQGGKKPSIEEISAAALTANRTHGQGGDAEPVHCGGNLRGQSAHGRLRWPKTLVAINPDASAAIFQFARFGVTGDYAQVVPAVIEEIKRIKD